MRILFIAPLPPPVNGHSLAAQAALNALTSKHSVTVVDLGKDSQHNGRISLRRFLAVIRVLRDVWRGSRDADAIYLTVSESVSGNLKDLLIYALCAGRLDRMVIHVHGGSIGRQLFDRFPSLRSLNILVTRRLQAVILTGESHREIFDGMIDRQRVSIIPNFADDSVFLPEDAIKAKFENVDPLRVLYLSSMSPLKGYDVVADAYMSLGARERNRIHIDFAGAFDNNDAQGRFEVKIASEPGLIYHGLADNAMRASLFSRAHAFILPTSFREGQPLSILEAYASGCVVVTTGQPGILDIFESGVHGWQVLPGSIESSRDALLRVLEAADGLSSMALRSNAEAEVRFRRDRFGDAVARVIVASGCASEEIRLQSPESNPPISRSQPMSGKSKRQYQLCANCIMDTSDSGIKFDARGWCDYCNNFHKNILPHWHPDTASEAAMGRQMDQIRRDGYGRDFDCLIGISGGVDSSYVTYLAREKWGLKPLLFHVDAGWNSQQAVHNVERLVEGLGLDLYTEVVNWHEMQDLQRAFFLAQVPHIDTPQDHAFFGGLYNFAAKHKVKYILTGANYSTECVREPLEWHYHASDLRQIRDIHRQFGRVPLETFPLSSIFEFKIYYRLVKGIRVVKPLDAVPYFKEQAMQELVDKFGWQRYAHKHYESRFTRFYEGYWLPTKFGYDKRRAHFSSLILTGQLTRAAALAKIAQPAYDSETIAQDFEYIATKLDLSVDELRAIMNGQNKTYRDYKNSMWLIGLGTRVLRAAGVQRAVMR